MAFPEISHGIQTRFRQQACVSRHKDFEGICQVPDHSG